MKNKKRVAIDGKKIGRKETEQDRQRIATKPIKTINLLIIMLLIEKSKYTHFSISNTNRNKQNKHNFIA